MYTLYNLPGSPRVLIVQVLLQYLGYEFELKDRSAPEFLDLSPLNKAPVLTGDKGLKLTQTLAIVDYVVNNSESEKAKGLVGRNLKERCEVLKWNSVINQELIAALAYIVLPILHYIPYNKQKSDSSYKELDALTELFENRLKDYTYLVGERLTVADLYGVLTLNVGFRHILDKEYIAAHPYIYRWFTTVNKHPLVAAFFADFQVLEKRKVYQPPKKEKTAEKAKPAAAEKAPKAAKPTKPAEEAAPAELPKPKHPLEALGKPKMPLDEWKRCYSNEETRETALPWFWDHFDPSEWSLYKVGYKYNDELTLTFMSNNLVGGFFNRLSASTKYLFGCLVVYGENNNNGIVGAFLVRGQDYAPAFDVAPDWESYEYSKLDPTKEEDKEFVNNMWAWDKPVIVNGEAKEIADGKVFK